MLMFLIPVKLGNSWHRLAYVSIEVVETQSLCFELVTQNRGGGDPRFVLLSWGRKI